MEHEDFSLNRDESIQNNIDATGKKWSIVPVRGLALYKVEPMDPRINVPKAIGGQWTKQEWLQEKVNRFLNESWDKAEEARQRTERTEQAKKEAKKKSVF